MKPEIKKILLKLNIFSAARGIVRSGFFKNPAVYLLALLAFFSYTSASFNARAFAAEAPGKRSVEPAGVPLRPENPLLAAAAKNHVAKISAVCASLQKYYSGRDSFQSFYSKIKNIGAARVIEINSAPVVYELPLISEDYTARFIYLDGEGCLLFPPAADASGSRYFLTAREWKEIARDNYALPSDSFSRYPDGYSCDYFPYYFNERHQNLIELCGVPADYEALSDFKKLDYLEGIPSKSIGKRKLTVLSRTSSEFGEFIPLKSFSYAAAYCADWWHMASSSSKEITFERYSDFISGKPAFGVNPRAVEMAYLSRAARESDFFRFSNYIKDPLFVNEKFHSSLEGYASVLVLPEISSAADIGDKNKIYSIDENNKFYMGEEYIELFRGHEASAETLVSALETHGIVMAGVSFYLKGVALSHSVKAVAVVGYKKTGGMTLFAYKDFEDPAMIFRIAPISLFSEAYCFAHEFKAKARYIVKNRKLIIETFNHKGINIDVNSISATFPIEERRVKFLKEAQGVYFHQVKKEDFSGIERAKLIAEIKKKYFVSGDNDTFTIKYGIY